MSEYTGLPLPTPEVENRLDQLDKTVCKSLDADDFPDWEEFLLDEENDPKLRMRQQLQRRNDCQGQALCNGEERRAFYVTGQIVQLSDTYAYQASEFHDGTIGRDRGTSIAAGVEVLTKGLPGIAEPGIPTESAFPYEPYYRGRNSFVGKARTAQIQPPHVSEHYAAPAFKQMLIGIAAGGSLHWGTYWPLPWGRDRVVINPGRAGRGGHATEGIWARKRSGEWELEVFNSHGDPEPFYVREDEYEFLRQRRNSPFGAFMILPDRVQERYEFKRSDWKRKLKA